MNKFIYSIFFSVVALAALIISAPSASAYDFNDVNDKCDMVLSHYSLDPAVYKYRGVIESWWVDRYNSPQRSYFYFVASDSLVFSDVNSEGTSFKLSGCYAYTNHMHINDFGHTYEDYDYYNLMSYNDRVSFSTSIGSFPPFFIANYFNADDMGVPVLVQDNIHYELLSEPVSRVEQDSEFDVLSGLYDITFTPRSCSLGDTDAFNLTFKDNTYDCYLQVCMSDNGYNIASIQCPSLAMATEQGVVFYGDFHFKHTKPLTASLDDLTISFATELPSESVDYIPASTYFVLQYVLQSSDSDPMDSYGFPLNSSMTINYLSFQNFANRVCVYDNIVLSSVDVSLSTGYPSNFYLHSCLGSNSNSAGSFVYNFNYSALNGLSEEDVKKDGKEDNDKKRTKSPYIPRRVDYPDDSTGFSTPTDLDRYDFSTLGDIFDSLFNDYVINLMIISCTVGLVGYILFGRGDT